MSIHGQINETQKHYNTNEFSNKLALNQHQNLVDTLTKHDIEVIILNNQPNFPEQVFTRDIGFTIGESFFIANMAHEARRGEENILTEWLKGEGLTKFSLINDIIEGGDVIVHGYQLYVGLSQRVNQQAIGQIKELLPKYEVIAIPFSNKYLHLDCVFNIISPTEALYFQPAFNQNEIARLANQFDLIPINTEEQFTLATNVLSLGERKILSLPINRQTNQQLLNRGYDVIEVDISEIIKSGGSFRCCTLPLLRE
ncbi:dimethylarginine dimethylaminohydrolase family protein [Salipaludibacillus sp. HK11]|uniref:dimethylarginine dimethylaminohydrolase family protein n=1 Tax=Salipaludibacillus sp. HK11 TaxID=3394320 RepID=UPI0039FCDC83